MTAAVDGFNSSIGKVGGGDAGDGKGNDDTSGGASSGVAALDRAVAAHQDGDVCGEIWKQLVHLAGPSGQFNVMLSLHQHHSSHHQFQKPFHSLQHSYCNDLHDNTSKHASVLAIGKIPCH